MRGTPDIAAHAAAVNAAGGRTPRECVETVVQDVRTAIPNLGRETAVTHVAGVHDIDRHKVEHFASEAGL